MDFIDLFAGLGGFHVALENLGHRCVFASELNESLRDLYLSNFGVAPVGDIRSVDPSDVPDHDILCAGFPCQPFSKSGKRLGFACPTNGTLFFQILHIIEEKRPEFVILENAPFLLEHEDGLTWKMMHRLLERAGGGYSVAPSMVLSPHQFGIPQHRKRCYIVAKRGTLSLKRFSEPALSEAPTDIGSILEDSPDSPRLLSPDRVECLETWSDFVQKIPSDEGFSSRIWSDEFGKTHSLDGIPDWKRAIASRSRLFYEQHEELLSDWLPSIRKFPNTSWRMLEWNASKDPEERNIWKHLIQFRPSGVRVRKRAMAPTLVTFLTQTPIIGWERRYLTGKECAKLQGLDVLDHFPDSYSKTMGALGNAVNVRVIEEVSKSLLETRDE